jgi:hypothetical protein
MCPNTNKHVTSLSLCMPIKYLKFFLLSCNLFCSSVVAQHTTLHPFLDPTISSWYRFSVEETGVQKMDKNFLKQLGIPVDDIDPRTLRIFGRGGQMLPLKNADQVETLYENAVLVVGEEDGSFDAADYMLFMGYAGDTWNTESQTFTNLYHETATYYITYGSSFGKRVIVEEGSSIIAADAVTSGTYQVTMEEDNYNIGSLGRRWFGIRFSDDQKETFSLPTPNVVNGTTIDVVARVAAAAKSNTSFTFTAGEKKQTTSVRPVGSTTVATEPSTRYNGITGIIQLEVDATQEVSGELSYAANGDFAAIGYLDFILGHYQRNLTVKGGSFLFSLDASKDVQELAISDVNKETTLWELNADVVHTPPEEVTVFGADVLVDDDTKFFLASEYKTPTFGRRLRNVLSTSFLSKFQSSPTTTYLLITTEQYRAEAERLISHRIENRGLQAQLVTLEEIYEAFSTGQQDIAAIRNFVRYLYESQNKQLKYLCLFGDTSFDYKKRSRTNDMVVPTFHAINSFSLTNSYMSDDFFTMMDAGEGLLFADDQMDLAVGRMVFSDKAQATVAVDKVIAYEAAQNKGSWNNSFTLLSDDVDHDWEYIIQERLDMLGDELIENKPFLNITKLHADAFAQVASAGGDRYPDVELALENRLSQGTLVVNYFGHGGEDGLSNEFLIDKNMASTLFHPNKYPLFITSTCEFSRFDNHDRQTAGELIYQNPTGGAIGLISTTRQIYVTNGINYNDILSNHLFSFGSDNYTSIAEALRKAKSEFSDNNQKRIIFYIGDPALKLHIPKREVTITHINGIALYDATNAQKQFSALDQITLDGVVSNTNGETLNSFNGTVALQVFDKEEVRTTLGNDGNRKMEFTSLGKQIFQGLASVKNGKFSSTFVVPKDINLELGEARITLIAFNDDKNESLGGFSDSFTIGGLNASVAEDKQGPEIDIFLNDKNFVDGDRVFSSPTLIIELADENGLNTAGGIGHDITAVLDSNQTNPIVLNAFYSASLDNFTKGTVTYPLNNLALGMHTLEIKAWDTHNNPSSKTITFWVMDSSNIEIERIFNSPNPVTNQTTFFVQHNRPRELLEANLYIFTMDGKRIWHKRQEVSSSGYVLDSLRWDATSYSGEKVNKGTYLYTIELISTLSQSTDTHSAKLIIE